LRPCGARRCRQRGRSRGQTQKIPTVGKFHGVPLGDTNAIPIPVPLERSLEFWLWHQTDLP
jgi:hypothetical protein